MRPGPAVRRGPGDRARVVAVMASADRHEARSAGYDGVWHDSSARRPGPDRHRSSLVHPETPRSPAAWSRSARRHRLDPATTKPDGPAATADKLAADPATSNVSAGSVSHRRPSGENQPTTAVLSGDSEARRGIRSPRSPQGPATSIMLAQPSMHGPSSNAGPEPTIVQLRPSVECQISPDWGLPSRSAVGSSPIATNPPVPAATSVIPPQRAGPGHGSTPSTVAGVQLRPSVEVHAPPPHRSSRVRRPRLRTCLGCPTGSRPAMSRPAGSSAPASSRAPTGSLSEPWPASTAGRSRSAVPAAAREEGADDRGPEQGGQQQRGRDDDEARAETGSLPPHRRLDDPSPHFFGWPTARECGDQLGIATELLRGRAASVTRPQVGLELVGFDRAQREVDGRGREEQDPFVPAHDVNPSAASSWRTGYLALDMRDRVAP